MTTVESAPSMKPINYSIKEVAKILGISRASVENLVMDGRIHSYKLGKRRLIPTSAILEFQSEALAAGSVEGVARGKSSIRKTSAKDGAEISHLKRRLHSLEERIRKLEEKLFELRTNLYSVDD